MHSAITSSATLPLEAEVAPSPQMATPVLFFDVFELHQLARSFSLDVLHDFARSQRGSTRQQHMHMVS
jgi:hypothetical protein